MLALMVVSALLPWSSDTDFLQRGDADALGEIFRIPVLAVLTAVLALCLFAILMGRPLVAVIVSAMSVVVMFLLFASVVLSPPSACWDGVDEQGRPIGNCSSALPTAGMMLATLAPVGLLVGALWARSDHLRKQRAGRVR